MKVMIIVYKGNLYLFRNEESQFCNKKGLLFCKVEAKPWVSGEGGRGGNHPPPLHKTTKIQTLALVYPFFPPLHIHFCLLKNQ